MLAHGRSHDVVDGVGLLARGVDLDTGRAVLVRIAGADAAAFEREVGVLRGLSRRPEVPSVRALTDGAVRVCVMSWPDGSSIEALLEAGLRVSEGQVRLILERTLSALVAFGALSPAVRHRALHVGNVFVSEQGRIQLIDFARATDRRDDGSAIVSARPGYGMPAGRPASSAAEDLYAVGALAAHLLTRVAPDELPAAPTGTPDFRAFADVGPELARFVDRLLAAGTRAGFASALAALRALHPAPTRFGTVAVALSSATLALAVAAGAAAAASLLRPPKPAPPALVVQKLQAPIWPAVHIDTSPTGAELWIDGAQLGTAPFSTLLEPGRHQVEARLARHRTVTQLVQVGEREHTLVLALAPTPRPAPKPVVEEARHVPRLWPTPREPTPEEIEAARERARLHAAGNELVHQIGLQTALRACKAPSDSCGDVASQAVTLQLTVHGTDLLVDDVGGMTPTARCVERIIEERVAAPADVEGLRGTVRVQLAPAFSVNGWNWRR
ncbi:MAG: PEGA domain-containing protein [Deltaproteobacteria bacterium]|nr:PEGA domain-containing protein [Deltaproteobacteria bacterium]